MNKAQLIEAVADKLGGRQQAADAVDAVLDAMLRAVDAGERVSVTGIGSFEKAAPRNVRSNRGATRAPRPVTGTHINRTGMRP